MTLVAAAWGVASPAVAVEPKLPAADGKPMLWPTLDLREKSGGRTEQVARYGFVDTDGDLVVAPRYRSYSYCPDTDGRPIAVLASGAGGSDLIDLTGEVIGQVDSEHAACIGKDHLIVTEPTAEGRGVGVIEVATGDQVLAPAVDQRVEAVTSDLANVARPEGEYFLDLVTRVLTPHQGRVTVAAQEAGAPGVPAAAQRSAAGKPVGKLGYLGRAGEWLITPQFDAASAFREGYAVVEQNGRATFLDTGLRRVGGQWDRILPVTVPGTMGEQVVGYRVEVDGRRGLLDPDLQVVVQPGSVEVDCSPDAGGACSVVAPDGHADLVQLPQGGVAALPLGFTWVLNAGLVADQPASAPAPTTRVHSLTTGRTVDLAGPTACHGVGRLFVSCAGSVVIGADGERSAFAHVTAIPDPAGGTAYYWVAAEREQGFLDPDGRWRYRERRS